MATIAANVVVSHSQLVLPEEMLPEVDQLVTEDGAPVDNVFSEKQQRLLTEPLHSAWAGPGAGRPFVAMTNVGLFRAVHEPPLVPDAMLSLDVRLPADIHMKAHRSYFLWEYGKAPDVVVEVVSNREGGEDTVKPPIYAATGVRYYVIYDPDQWLAPEKLRVFALSGGTYRKYPEPIWFAEVGLGLRLWEGRYEDMDAVWLRWFDAEDRLVPTGRELAEQERGLADEERQHAHSERQRAEQERQRAEHEHQRAEQEQQRADRLIQQLRRLGVEPENGEHGRPRE